MSRDMQKTAALASLTENYTDSEVEPDSDEDSNAPTSEVERPPSVLHRDSPASSPSDSRSWSKVEIVVNNRSTKPVARLVSYAGDDLADDEIERASEEEMESDAASSDHNSTDSRKSADTNQNKLPSSPVSFHRYLQEAAPNEIAIPPEPSGRCSNGLQEKISRLYEKKLREGKDMNASIQGRKDFRNPSIYEKLIHYCQIDEMGTNYPPEIYDPHKWGKESFYEELAKRQKEEMDKREKEKKDRTKVEFISGTAKRPATDVPVAGDSKRKSKWDVGSNQATLLPNAIKPATLITPSVVPVATATGTKPTVISAFGTISKKKP